MSFVDGSAVRGEGEGWAVGERGALRRRHLAEEVEVELVLAGVELDVLDAQRAAADGVGLLVGVLLVADAERQLVDEVHL